MPNLRAIDDDCGIEQKGERCCTRAEAIFSGVGWLKAEATVENRGRKGQSEIFGVYILERNWASGQMKVSKH